jgi:hypothetical protein
MRTIFYLAACLGLLDFSAATASTSRIRTKFNWNQTSHVYAFGDSYTFVQGTRGHANYSFIGDAFDLSFPPLEILENEIVSHNVSFQSVIRYGRCDGIILDKLRWSQLDRVSDRLFRRLSPPMPTATLELCIRGRRYLRPPVGVSDLLMMNGGLTRTRLPLHHNFTVPLIDQVKQYITYASYVLPHPKGRTLTAWWIGINDTGDTIGNVRSCVLMLGHC